MPLTSAMRRTTRAAEFPAPNTYPTLIANGGAGHLIVPGYSLGPLEDNEPNGQPNATATGDDLADTDDEDGVVFNGPFIPGLTTSVTVTLNNTAGLTSAFLDGWIDWNADGDWTDPGEQVFTSQILGPASGSTNFNIAVPLNAVLGTTFARFRLSSSGGLAPTGLDLVDGEVEDYRLEISPFFRTRARSPTSSRGSPATASPSPTSSWTWTSLC